MDEKLPPAMQAQSSGTGVVTLELKDGESCLNFYYANK